MFQKIAVIIYTIDPEDNVRILLRHNKPFDGYEDEWTFVFGGVDEGENLEVAAVREVFEEFGITEYEKVENINRSVTFSGKRGLTEAHFFVLKTKDIDVKVSLNEESIGYDWLLLKDSIPKINYKDEQDILNEYFLTKRPELTGEHGKLG